jgi:hypothetical protein
MAHLPLRTPTIGSGLPAWETHSEFIDAVFHRPVDIGRAGHSR